MIHCLAQGMIVGGKAQAATRLLASVFSRNVAPTSSFKSHEVIFRPSIGMTNTSRNLYSEASLGMEKLENLRDKKRQLFVGPSRERYISRLEGYSRDGDLKSFFKDDLINLLGIAETDKDLDLLESLVLNIEPDQQPLFKGWGTTIMRLYYRMNQLERACKNIKDEKFGDFFNQRGCYKILMTMLFNAARYDDVIDMYHFANSRLNNPSGGPERYLTTIVYAAFAKMNNPEALRRAQEFYNKFSQETRTSSRSIQYLAYLAVNNGNPKYAINLISMLSSGNQYLTLKNLKLISLIKLERHEDILVQLREYVNFVRRDSFILLNETLNMIQRSLDNIQESGVRQELSDLLVEIKEGGHVSDAKMSELLFKEINDYPRIVPEFRDNNSFSKPRYQNQDPEDGPRLRSNYKPRQYNRDLDFNPRQERQNQQRSPGRRFTYQNLDLTS